MTPNTRDISTVIAISTQNDLTEQVIDNIKLIPASQLKLLENNLLKHAIVACYEQFVNDKGEGSPKEITEAFCDLYPNLLIVDDEGDVTFGGGLEKFLKENSGYPQWARDTFVNIKETYRSKQHPEENEAKEG